MLLKAPICVRSCTGYPAQDPCIHMWSLRHKDACLEDASAKLTSPNQNSTRISGHVLQKHSLLTIDTMPSAIHFIAAVSTFAAWINVSDSHRKSCLLHVDCCTAPTKSTALQTASYKPIMVWNTVLNVCSHLHLDSYNTPEPELQGVFAVIHVTCASCPAICAPPGTGCWVATVTYYKQTTPVWESASGRQHSHTDWLQGFLVSPRKLQCAKCCAARLSNNCMLPL